MWQAEFVQNELHQLSPNITTELISMTSRGDEIQDRPLADIGGKALFVKSLEEALLRGEADIAVHSMKDVPAVLPDEFVVAAVCKRASPFDALVTVDGKKFAELPKGAVVGTSSYRRAAQLLAKRPDLKIKPVRGNVQTRLDKLGMGEYDALILAEAGLVRLGLTKIITEILPATFCVPGAGQGAVGIECKKSDVDILHIIGKLNHLDTLSCVIAERALQKRLNGDCHSPIGSYAEALDGQIKLHGYVGSLDGKSNFFAKASAPQISAASLGEEVADNLLAQGAKL